MQLGGFVFDTRWQCSVWVGQRAVPAGVLDELAVSTWVAVLLQTSSTFTGLGTQVHGARRTSFQAPGRVGRVSNRTYLWQRWRGLVSLLAGLASRRVGFIGLVDPQLGVFAEALGWYTWTGSPLGWLLAGRCLRLGPRRGLGVLRMLPTRTCAVVTGVRWGGLVQEVAGAVPAVGLFTAAAGSGTSLLWATGGVCGSHSLELEFFFLAVVWLVIRGVGCTRGVWI